MFIFTENVAVGSRFLNPSPALLGAGVTFLCSSVSLGQSIDHLSNEVKEVSLAGPLRASGDSGMEMKQRG